MADLDDDKPVGPTPMSSGLEGLVQPEDQDYVPYVPVKQRRQQQIERRMAKRRHQQAQEDEKRRKEDEPRRKEDGKKMGVGLRVGEPLRIHTEVSFCGFAHSACVKAC